jgi:transposase
VFPVSVHDLT